MKIIQTKLPSLKHTYPLDSYADLEQILFIDIETTGFTAKGSILYLIGCIYYKDNSWQLIQWFADQYSDEKELLSSFFKFSRSYHYLIHFNGNNFDIPYLLQKAAQFGLPNNFDDFEALDIYRRIAPYKNFLKLPNCKQKTIETFLNIKRDDIFSGGDLISVYHNYVKTLDESSLRSLLLHNADDIQGLVEMLPILAYHDLFQQPIKVTKVQANYYKDYIGTQKQEILMKLKFHSSLPVTISKGANDCYFTGYGMEGSLKIPLYEEEMKYFYSNYRDYFYLPREDMAMHKSVASFVDKEYRIKATAATCYTRKNATYLPQWDILFEPFFKRDFSTKEIFFELTDDFKKQRNEFSKYTRHVLETMLKKA